MVWWLTALAFAQSPSPAARCASAAEGSEIEVCLKLAAENPDAVDEINVALSAHIDRGSSADRELLRGLLLLNSAQGVQGAQALAQLDDPRALAALLRTALTADEPAIAAAATEAMAAYQEGRALLGDWLTDGDRDMPVRIAAAEALARREETTAVDSVVDALRQPRIPSPLRRAMIDGLTVHHPERLPESGNQVSVDGTPWTTVTGAWNLGMALGAAGHYGGTELAPLGAGTGLIAGGTAGYLIGRAVPMEADDASFITVNTVSLGASGMLIGAGFAPEGRPLHGAWAGGTLGAALGTGLSVPLIELHGGRRGDNVEAGVFAGTATVGTAAISSFLWDTTEVDRRTPLAAGAVGAGALVLGHGLAPVINMGRGDVGIVALGGAYGASVGLMAPFRGDRGLALGLAGLSGGTLAAYVVAGPTQLGWDTAVGGTIGLAYGGAVMHGLTTWSGASEANHDRAVIIGLTAGMGTGATLAYVSQGPIDDRDVFLAGLASGWTLAQAVGWRQVAQERAGLEWALPAIAGGTVGVLSPIIDVPVFHASAVTSFGLWGGYLGGTAAGLSGNDPLSWALIGGNAGLVVGGVTMAAGTPPLVVAIGDAGGLLGGATAALIAGVSRTDTPVLLAASVGGSAVGFGVGVYAGHRLYASGRTRSVALGPVKLPGQWSLVPAMIPGRDEPAMGARLQVQRW